VPLPILALTQGDPAGIGPEILLKLLSEESGREARPFTIDLRRDGIA
jgi:4-hydroxy-L-threonine phosphate dehydrogenase PdxA